MYQTTAPATRAHARHGIVSNSTRSAYVKLGRSRAASPRFIASIELGIKIRFERAIKNKEGARARGRGKNRITRCMYAKAEKKKGVGKKGGEREERETNSQKEQVS